MQEGTRETSDADQVPVSWKGKDIWGQQAKDWVNG